MLNYIQELFSMGEHRRVNVSAPKPIRTAFGSLRAESVKKNNPSQHKIGSIKESQTKVGEQKPTMRPLTYFLGPGNNSKLVRQVMQTRAIWSQSADSTSAFINFKWQQDQKGFKYDRLVDFPLCRTVYNQFECHDSLTNKEFLFKNLQSYCSKHGLCLWAIVPATFVLNVKDQCNMQVLAQFLDVYTRNYPKAQRTTMEKDSLQVRQSLKRIFFSSNLKKSLQKSPPLRDCFLDTQGEYLWIVKPTFLNRGRGIQVFSKLQTLYKYIAQNLQGYIQKPLIKVQSNEKSSPTIDYVKRNSQNIGHSNNVRRQYRFNPNQQSSFDGNQYIRVQPKGPSIIRTDKFLVQKYLQRPLLIRKHKFDIRMWAMITHGLKGMVFRQGYIRLSSMEYRSKDADNNPFMHLTNNAIQKYAADYGVVADGNQLSFADLKEVMKELDYDGCMQIIHSHMRSTFAATIKNLNPHARKYTFQIYGFDFMIDHTGYPWLLEVNTNPCIEESSALLKALLPRMLDDAFKLTIDVLFYGSVSHAVYPVPGYPHHQNLWLNLNINPL